MSLGLSHLLRLSRAGYVFAREGVLSLVDARPLPVPARMLVGLGRLIARPDRFPSTVNGGFRPFTDKIHAMGLKAGIYSDLGRNTCSQAYGGDDPNLPKGSMLEREVGLYGHIDQDIALFFRDWGFDFIKVDGCGLRAYGADSPKVKTGDYRALKPAAETVRTIAGRSGATILGTSSWDLGNYVGGGNFLDYGIFSKRSASQSLSAFLDQEKIDGLFVQPDIYPTIATLIPGGLAFLSDPAAFGWAKVPGSDDPRWAFYARTKG